MRRLLAALTVVATLAAGCAPVTPQRAVDARELAKGINGAAVTLQLAETPRTMSPFAPIGSAEQRLAQIHFLPLLAGSDSLLVRRFTSDWVPFDAGRKLALVAPRARWSDGRWLSARDVIASIEAHLDPRSESPYANELLAIKGAREFREGRASSVSGLTSDAFRNTVIHLEQPNPHYIEHLTQIPVMPQHVYPTLDAMVTADYRSAPVGSGPYIIERWEPDGSVALKPNPRVAEDGRQSPLRGIIARPVRPADVGREMSAGRLDVADSHALDAASLPAGARLETSPGNTLVTLTPAPGRLTDPRVRRAILQAIDRRALVADELGGRGRVADSVIFRSNFDGGGPAHDPEAARRLLKEAGWDPSQPVRIAAVAQTGRSQLWEKLGQQLRAAGINAQVTQFDPQEQAGLIDRGDYDLLGGQWTAATRQPSLVSALVRCGGSKETNTGEYCNPELDRRLDEATASVTVAEQAERWGRVNDLLVSELPVLPLFVPDSVIAESASMGPIDPTLVPLTGLIDLWVRIK